MAWRILQILLIAISKVFELVIRIFGLLIDGLEMLINVVKNKC
jgi:hypothetical protein